MCFSKGIKRVCAGKENEVDSEEVCLICCDVFLNIELHCLSTITISSNQKRKA